MNTRLEAALRYASVGHPIFPCVPNEKVPLTENGFEDATTDPETIREWWLAHPSANIALSTETFFVVEIDGKTSWPRDYTTEHILEKAPTICTPSYGRYWIFRKPAGKLHRNPLMKLPTGLTIHGHDSFILLPHSLVGGRPYEWISGKPIFTYPVGCWPRPLLEDPYLSWKSLDIILR